MSINIGILESSRSGYEFLLDKYPGAAAAYSLRKLRSAYTGAAIRVRNSSSAEMDIGFVNNVLDSGTLLTFVGSGNGSVVTWYDQSGNGRNAQHVLFRASIVNSGILQTLNTKPAINLPNFTIPPFTVIGDVSYFMVQNKVTSNQPGINIGSQVGSGLLFSNSSDNNIYFQRSNGTNGFLIGAADSTTGNQILNAFNNSGAMSMYKNNNIYTLNTSFSFSIASSQINRIGFASQIIANGLSPELIIYANSQLSNRIQINTNINKFYTIY